MIFTRREASSENQTLNFIEFCCESVEFAGFFHSKDNLTFSCFERQPSVRVMKEKKEFRSLFSQKQSIIFRAKLNHQPFLLRTTHRRKNFHWMNDAPPIHEMPILERIRNAIWPPPGRHPHHHYFDRSRSQQFLSDLTRPKSDPGNLISSAFQLPHLDLIECVDKLKVGGHGQGDFSQASQKVVSNRMNEWWARARTQYCTLVVFSWNGVWACG